MVALFVMPSSLVMEMLNYYPFSPWLCSIWVGLDVLCCTSSIHHMSTMALDRYLTIKFPFKYGRNKSKRITLVKIIVVWFISLLICSPLLVISYIDESSVYNSSNRICQLYNKTFRLYGSIFAFFIPFLIMLIAYVSTIRILKKVLDKKLDDKKQRINENLRFLQKKTFTNILEGLLIQTSLQLDLDSLNNKKPSNSSNTNISNRNTNHRTLSKFNRSRYSFVNYQSIKNVAQNEKKALKVLIIIFCVFSTLWCPFFVLNTATALCEECVKIILADHDQLIYSVLTWLGYLSSMANPIVYTMFNKSFRTAFINILKCKKVSIDQPTRMSFRHPVDQNNQNFQGEESNDDLDDIAYLNSCNDSKYKQRSRSNSIKMKQISKNDSINMKSSPTNRNASYFKKFTVHQV